MIGRCSERCTGSVTPPWLHFDQSSPVHPSLYDLTTLSHFRDRELLPEALPWIAAAIVMATVDAAVRWAARLPSSLQTTMRSSVSPSSHRHEHIGTEAARQLKDAQADPAEDASELNKMPTWWRRPCFYMLLHAAPELSGLLMFHDGEDTIVPVYEVRHKCCP
jgi:hypothetical protein